MLFSGLAYSVAVLHLAVVVLVLAGGGLALRFPRLRAVHLGVTGVVVAVNLTGRDCPLTTLELDLLRHAGGEGYGGGFVEHYLVTPVHPAGLSPTASTLITLTVVGVNLVAYAAALGRRRGGRAAPHTESVPSS